MSPLIPNHHPAKRDGLVLWLDSKNTGSVAATGTWEDYSGLGNNGTLVADAYVDETGLNLDGTGDYVTVTDSATLDVVAITVNMWAKAPSSPSDSTFQKLLNKVNSYDLVFDNPFLDGMCFRIYDGGWKKTGSITSEFPASEWAMVTGTYDGTTLRLYVNAVQKATGSHTGAIDASANDIGIGAIQGGSEIFTGQIDGIQIFSRALSAGEIQAVYQRTLRA